MRVANCQYSYISLITGHFCFNIYSELISENSIMSFPSTTSYGEPNLYRHKVTGDSSGLSSPLFTSDKQIFHYGRAPYNSELCSQQYFNSASNPGSGYYPQVSSSPYQLVSDMRSSIISDNPFNSCFTAVEYNDSPLGSSISHQTSHSQSHEQSPENEMEYDEDDFRLKLQEIERTLLNDSDEEVMVMDDDDDDWAETIKDLILSSPNESSTDSNISSTSSISGSRTPKQLLFDCAAAISEGDMEEASGFIAELRQMVSIQGDPSQRLSAYLVESLAARMASSGQGLYKALKCKEPPTLDRLSAMQILFEICPCFKLGFMAANGAIIEACKDEEKVHIIDFDINQGSQYINLIQDLSRRPTKPPRLRITGVDDSESVQRRVGGLRVIGQRLETFAEDLGVPFEFGAIAAKTGDVTPSMLDCRPGEALIVNFAFQLHHMPDESVSTVNERDRLLRMVKSLEPKLVTVVEQDANTNTAPFFPRFVEVYNYYLAVFESLDATMSRENPDRMNVEKQCLARDIVNIVACEGAERIERYEAAGKWRARMNMAGFVSCPLSTYVNGAIRSLLKSYCDKFKVKEEGGALNFGWEDKILVVFSAWR